MQPTDAEKLPGQFSETAAYYFVCKFHTNDNRTRAKWQQDGRGECFRRDSGMFHELADSTEALKQMAASYRGEVPATDSYTDPFETRLLFWESFIARDIAECTVLDIETLEEDCSSSDFDMYGWRRSLFNAIMILKRLRKALGDGQQNEALQLSLQLGRLLSEYMLRQSFEDVVLAYKQQCSPLEQKRIELQADTEIRRLAAIAELQRRKTLDPKLTKNKIMSAMAKERFIDEKGKQRTKWGCKRTLTGYLKSITFTSPK